MFWMFSQVPLTNLPIVVMTKPKDKDITTKYQVYRRVSHISILSYHECPHQLYSPSPWTFLPWRRSQILRPNEVAGYCHSVVIKKIQRVRIRLSALPVWVRVPKSPTTPERYTLVRFTTMVEWEVCTHCTLNPPKRGWSGRPS